MLRPFGDLRGSTLVARDGEIGKVRDFYFDDERWTIAHVVVETGWWRSRRRVLIMPAAVGELDAAQSEITVDLTKEQVRNSPPVNEGAAVSRQGEEPGRTQYFTPVTVGMWPPPPTHGPLAQAIAERHGATSRFPHGGAVFEPAPAGASPARIETEGDDAHLRSSAELVKRYSIQAQDGRTGWVQDFIIDDKDWLVRYLVVRTGWFSRRDVLLAPAWIERISSERAKVLVDLPRAALKSAPKYAARTPIGRAFQQRLHDHYERAVYWNSRGTRR